VVPGELTVVTGVPNSGKSEWIDALICNLNKSSGWKFALCSMENQVREHARKLLEKHMKKPFFDARYGESVERMSVDEFEEGKKWLGDTFYLIRCENDSLPNINWVLKLAKSAVLRYGINGLVIDPYNELDHQRPPNHPDSPSSWPPCPSAAGCRSHPPPSPPSVPPVYLAFSLALSSLSPDLDPLAFPVTELLLPVMKFSDMVDPP
ncbi:hypothetical protein C3L33_06630, partial [Rhododendron williamsianum]